MIESLEKLRVLVGEAVGLSEHERLPKTRLLAPYDVGRLADEIEREIAERYMELPLDADGVPIHVGDSIEYPNGERDVVRFITVNDNMPTFNESGWIASKCRHVKPRTVEDVLESFIVDYDTWDEDCKVDRLGERRLLFAKYADELRGMMGGE